MKTFQFIGIIPARYASTRFPGKPLADLGGKPMIQHVYEQARKALEYVVVATDDMRIFEAVKAFGGEVVMTSTEHRSGTDRCCEAYHNYVTLHPDFHADVVINIQGDEPFIQPEQIKGIKACFPTNIATLVKPYTGKDTLEDLLNPNTPKVIFNPETGRAIYFSRSVIPYKRGIPQEEWLQNEQYYKHLGMYAYTVETLEEITKLPQSHLELAESLEQLRWIENGYEIKVAITNVQSIGIDTPEDLEKAVKMYNF